MKITVEGLGVVEGTEDEIQRLIARMTRNTNGHNTVDNACLTPSQRLAFDEVARHPAGCHTSVVAEAVGLSESVTNTRLNSIVKKHPEMLQRIQRGMFKVVQ